MTDVLRHPAFRNLWLAGLLSTLGSEISRIGLFLYLFHARDSVYDLALLVALKTLPGALVAPLAGLAVDRLGKRGLMITSDLAQALYLLGILLWPTFGVIYLVAALQSVTAAVFEPAKRAAIPLVVERREIGAANGIDLSARNLTMILGPVAGAEIFIHWGLVAILIADIVSYLLSAALLSRVTVRQVAGEGPATPAAALAEVRSGWRYFRRNEIVLNLTLLFSASMLCSGLWVPLAPFFIRDVLGASDRVLGLQICAFGIGGVIGGLLAPRLIAQLDAGRVLFAALLAEGIHLTAYALVPDVALSSLLLCPWGIAVAVIGVASHSILQTRVDELYLGRVFALVNQGENLAMLLAMCLAAALGEILGSHVIFLVAGLTYLTTVATSSLTRGGRALRVVR